MKQPKILYIDIETSYLTARIWRTGNQYITIDQIKDDWELLSFSAIWNDDKPNKMIYMDRSNGRSEKTLVRAMKKLMDEADWIVGQNSDNFDIKRINAKLEQYKLGKPDSFRTFDTYKVGKKYFGFTSHKLSHMCKVLGVKYQKSSHSKFPGMSLWIEAHENNNPKAWNEMKTYNSYDVLAMRECAYVMRRWEPKINFDLYHDEVTNVCSCGSTEFIKKGFHYTETGMFQRYKCKRCGTPYRSRDNLFDKQKRKSLRIGIK